VIFLPVSVCVDAANELHAPKCLQKPPIRPLDLATILLPSCLIRAQHKVVRQELGNSLILRTTRHGSASSNMVAIELYKSHVVGGPQNDPGDGAGCLSSGRTRGAKKVSAGHTL
jgi:hypothetical protein